MTKLCFALISTFSFGVIKSIKPESLAYEGIKLIEPQSLAYAGFKTTIMMRELSKEDLCPEERQALCGRLTCFVLSETNKIVGDSDSGFGQMIDGSLKCTDALCKIQIDYHRFKTGEMPTNGTLASIHTAHNIFIFLDNTFYDSHPLKPHVCFFKDMFGSIIFWVDYFPIIKAGLNYRDHANSLRQNYREMSCGLSQIFYGGMKVYTQNNYMNRVSENNYYANEDENERNSERKILLIKDGDWHIIEFF